MSEITIKVEFSSFFHTNDGLDPTCDILHLSQLSQSKVSNLSEHLPRGMFDGSVTAWTFFHLAIQHRQWFVAVDIRTGTGNHQLLLLFVSTPFAIALEVILSAKASFPLFGRVHQIDVGNEYF